MRHAIAVTALLLVGRAGYTAAQSPAVPAPAGEVLGAVAR